MPDPSTNPFRNRGRPSSGPNTLDRPAMPQAASSAAFLESIASASADHNGSPIPSKAKVVKRVRVQSPPPSPDSPSNMPHRQAGDDSDESSSQTSDSNPFATRFPANPDSIPGMTDMPEAAPLVAANRGGPDNPFSRASGDIEEDLEEEEASANATTKPILDVNAFQKLLLTGQTQGDSGITKEDATENTQTQPTHIATKNTLHPSNQLESGSLRDTDQAGGSSSLTQQVTPGTSSESLHESEGQESALNLGPASPASKRGRPPPPPSSRHGKSIKASLQEDSISPNSSSPSEVNKPLPPAPSIHTADEGGIPDVFTQEALGKIPEDVDSAMSSFPPEAGASAAPGKRPTPAPPPRRGHGRSESKTSHPVNNLSIPGIHDDDSHGGRSSMDSQHSRNESIRNAPAPPPPRRPGAPQRRSSLIASQPTSSSMSPMASPAMSETEGVPQASPFEQEASTFDDAADDASIAPSQQKTSRPPPPPTRNPSVRRPGLLPRPAESASTTRRLVSSREKENMSAPPPPPPRQRGNSKGTTDALASRRPTSADNVPKVDDLSPAGAEALGVGKGQDILADLDALQREVDALRGKFKDNE